MTGSNAAAAAWQVCMVKSLAAGKAKQKEAEMKELLVPPDLPIEMIAEEVKESWRLKEVHVEKLMQKVSCCESSLLHGWQPVPRAIGHTRGSLAASPGGRHNHHAISLQPFCTMLQVIQA